HPRDNVFGADLLGISLFYRLRGSEQLVALGELMGAKLAALLEIGQALGILARLDVSAVFAGFLAGLEDRFLQISRQSLERLAAAADRAQRYGMLGGRSLGADVLEFHHIEPALLVLVALH